MNKNHHNTSSFLSNGNSTTLVKFPTICANNPIKSTILPLGYQVKVKPDVTKQCDLPECTVSSQNDDWTVLTGFFHSFHNTCLNGLNSCPLCKDFPKEKVKELGQRLTRASNTSENPTRIPPHCRKCHHPIRGHKRSNGSQVKCDFCPNNVCAVNSDNSFSRCNCSWHRENHTQSNTLPAPTYQITVTANQHVDVT